MPSFSTTHSLGRTLWARASIAGSSYLRFTILSGIIKDELAATFKYGLFVAPFVATRAERLDSKAKKLQ
jgi:hypothetical protein